MSNYIMQENIELKQQIENFKSDSAFFVQERKRFLSETVDLQRQCTEFAELVGHLVDKSSALAAELIICTEAAREAGSVLDKAESALVSWVELIESTKDEH